MADCDWAILCDYAFLDVNRKMCLIGTFNQINSAAVPSVHPQASLALKIIGEGNEKVPIRVEIVRPSGGLLGKLEGEIQLGESGSGEVNLNMAALPIPDWGLYSFNVYLGDQLTKTAGFTVQKIEQKKKP